MESKHTSQQHVDSRPIDVRQYLDTEQWAILDPDGVQVGTIDVPYEPSDDDYSNAELAAEVKRRWNAHPDLLEALRTGEQRLDTLIDVLLGHDMRAVAEAVIEVRNGLQHAILKAS